MKSSANSVEEYIQGLSEERKIAEDIITKFNKELNTLEQMK